MKDAADRDGRLGSAVGFAGGGRGCAEHRFVREAAQATCALCGLVVQKPDATPRELWLQWKIGAAYRLDASENPGGVLQYFPPMWFLEQELGLFEGLA